MVLKYTFILKLKLQERGSPAYNPWGKFIDIL